MDLGLKQDIEFYSEGNQRKVVLPFNRLKNWSWLIVTIVSLGTIFGAIGKYLFDSSKEVSVIYLIVIVLIVLFGALILNFFLIMPTKLILTSNSNELIIDKTDWFYKKTYLKIKKTEKPYLILRGKRWVGPSVYLGKNKIYDIMIGWIEDNRKKEINLRPNIYTYSSLKSIASLKKITKEDLIKISEHLGIRFSDND